MSGDPNSQSPSASVGDASSSSALGSTSSDSSSGQSTSSSESSQSTNPSSSTPTTTPTSSGTSSSSSDSATATSSPSPSDSAQEVSSSPPPTTSSQDPSTTPNSQTSPTSETTSIPGISSTSETPPTSETTLSITSETSSIETNFQTLPASSPTTESIETTSSVASSTPKPKTGSPSRFSTHKTDPPSSSSSSSTSPTATFSNASTTPASSPSTPIPTSLSASSSSTALGVATSTDVPKHSNSFLSNRPAVIGTFTAVGVVVLALLLAILFFLLKRKRNYGGMAPSRSRSLGGNFARGGGNNNHLDNDHEGDSIRSSGGGYVYADVPNSPMSERGLGTNATPNAETRPLGVGSGWDTRLTTAATAGVAGAGTGADRTEDYGLLAYGGYSSERDREMGYKIRQGQVTNFSYPSLSSTPLPSYGSLEMAPSRAPSEHYGYDVPSVSSSNASAIGGRFSSDTKQSSPTYNPSAMMAPVLDTGLSSYRPTTPFSAPSRVSSPGYTDPWAERAIAKTTATALGKEVFSDRNSAAYSIYGGVAVGSPSQISTPIPIQEQPIEPLIDIFSDEPTTTSSGSGIYNSQAGPGTLTRAKSNASALGKEVFQRFGTGQATPRSDTQNFW